MSGVKIAKRFHQEIIRGGFAVIAGKIRAWIEHRTKPGVLAAFVGVPGEGDAPLQRPPATRLCASLDEAKQWIETEARAIGVPIEWASGPHAPLANAAD
jgi:hypothetical protein